MRAVKPFHYQATFDRKRFAGNSWMAADGLSGLDASINVAGRPHAVKSISELTTELVDWTFKTNVYAMF
jgi:hypothetical protein